MTTLLTPAQLLSKQQEEMNILLLEHEAEMAEQAKLFESRPEGERQDLIRESVSDLMKVLRSVPGLEQALTSFSDFDGFDEDANDVCDECGDVHVEKDEIELIKVSDFGCAGLTIALLRTPEKDIDDQYDYYVHVEGAENHDNGEVMTRATALTKYQGYVSSGVVDMALNHV